MPATLREAELDALMGDLARGDRDAFAPLYAALRPRAVGLARRRLGDANAGDVAQTALLKVFARAGEFTPGRACLPWFYAIVANEIRAEQRRAKHLIHGDTAHDPPSPDHDAETQLVAKELERALEMAVAGLDAEAAEAIAAMLGRGPPPNVKSPTLRKRISRAYAKLRLLLGSHHAG